MARYQLIWDGDIKEYYDDFSDWSSYECTGCHHKAKEFTKLSHSKECKIVRKWRANTIKRKKQAKIVASILAKLSPLEIHTLKEIGI